MPLRLFFSAFFRFFRQRVFTDAMLSPCHADAVFDYFFIERGGTPDGYLRHLWLRR